MLKHELSVQIGLECLFGRASDFYTKVYEAGLIDESYAYDFSLEKGFGFAIVGSDSAKPDQLAESIIEEMNKAQFNEEAIERVKRKKIGFYLRALNSIEFIANQFTRYKFNEMNLFDAVPVIEKLTIEDIKEAFKSIQGESQQTIFKILPVSERN
ncbi:M16 family metallopeptidase [Rhizophagus irregularis]|nr:M16 family metallopeptidase [Rhizophagus irregularis]